MSRFPLLRALPFAVLPTLLVASPYDYSYGTIARYEAENRERGFQKYMSSGSKPFVVDSNAVANAIRNSLSGPPKSSYSTPSLPNGQRSWNGYLDSYNASAIRYMEEQRRDTRTEQQKTIDAAKAGNVIAMHNLAYYYLAGSNGFPKNTSNGIYWFRQAFEHGRIEMGTELYKEYDPGYTSGGHDVVKNPIEAVYWLRRAAQAGDPEAMGILGDRMLAGEGVDKDVTAGIRLMQLASDRGYRWALRDLVFAYEHGRGVSRDLDEAARYQRLAWKRDQDPDDVMRLVKMLADGDESRRRQNSSEIQTLLATLPQRPKFQWLRAQMTEAGFFGPAEPLQIIGLAETATKLPDNGWEDKEAQFEAALFLGDSYFSGAGVPANSVKAYRFYRQAEVINPDRGMSVERELNYASLMIGQLSDKTADGTVKTLDRSADAFKRLTRLLEGYLNDENKSRAYLLAAHVVGLHPELESKKYNVYSMLADARTADPNAALGIAVGLHNGWFGDSRKDDAMEAIHHAFKYDDEPGAYWYVRWLCEESEDADKEWVKFAEKLIAAKNWPAYPWLAGILIEGKKLPRDLKRAETLLRAAAKEGPVVPYAENDLGLALWRGTFGEKHIDEGLAFLEQSLAQGHGIAGRNLAKIYHLGMDVPKDEAKAVATLERVGKLGPTEAALVSEAYAKGEIITADPAASSRWKALAAAGGS